MHQGSCLDELLGSLYCALVDGKHCEDAIGMRNTVFMLLSLC